MTKCYLGIGSNLGDRRGYITDAIEKINQLAGTRVTKVSAVIESAAAGVVDQGDFLNAVIEVETAMTCRQLLPALQEIESRFGRLRSVKNQPRVIDLDILLFGGEIFNEPDLIVPHPRMKERDFVMGPLKEIAPDIAARI